MIAPTPKPVSVVVFSRHALDRLEERKISPSLVEKLLEEPFMRGTSRGALYSAGTVTDGLRRLWLTVIHGELSPTGQVDVVTVYVGVTASRRSMNEREWMKAKDEAKRPRKARARS